MSRKKQTKTAITYKELEKLFNTTEEERVKWYNAFQGLRKQLDDQADRYNLVNEAQTVRPKGFLEKESQRRITSTYDLQQFVQEVYARGLNIIGFKNRDYGDHKNSDPFGNFRRHALKGFLVRIDDKLARLNTFCDTGKLAVMDESVLDTIVDAANYLAIMAAFIYNENLPKETVEDFKLKQNQNSHWTKL